VSPLDGTSETETSYESPWLASTLQSGQPVTFRCDRTPCWKIHLGVPPEGVDRVDVTVLSERAGGYSIRASMEPGPHWEPLWSDGVYYEGGVPHPQASQAPFNATAWMLEFLSMWDGAGGNVTVTAAW
jgi:hypothetical protein